MRIVASGRSKGSRLPELLLDDVADHALRLGAEDVERVGLDVLVGRSLERQEPDLRPVAVRHDELVVRRDPGQRLRRDPDVGPLVLGGHRLALA